MKNIARIAPVIACFLAASLFADEAPKIVKLSKAEYEAMELLGDFKITDDIKIDLETIYAGDVKSGLMKIRNTTSRDIKIMAVKSSCGCSAIYPSSTEIPSGQELEMAVKMKGTRPGSLRATLTIETDVKDYTRSVVRYGRTTGRGDRGNSNAQRRGLHILIKDQRSSPAQGENAGVYRWRAQQVDWNSQWDCDFRVFSG